VRLGIPTDSGIERLVVAGDPVVRATQDFERLFPDVEHALLMLEAPDPLNLESLQATLALEQQLAKIPNGRLIACWLFIRTWVHRPV